MSARRLNLQLSADLLKIFITNAPKSNFLEKQNVIDKNLRQNQKNYIDVLKMGYSKQKDDLMKIYLWRVGVNSGMLRMFGILSQTRLFM